MRHFNYFENGGPAPSACLSCGGNKKLFDLGREIPVTGGMAQLCLTCATELAVFIGYAEKAPLMEQIGILEADVEAHEIELAKVPDLVDGLINGIRSSVTDFIFAVSYSDSADNNAHVEDPAKPVIGPNQGGEAPAGRKQTPSKSAGK